MRDRIEQLEALSRLRAEGTLTEEEFTAEKARILSEEGGATVMQPGARRPVLVAGVALSAAAVFAGAGWLATGLGRIEPAATSRPAGGERLVGVSRASPPSSPTMPTPTASASPTAPAPVELGAALRFSSPAKCQPEGTLEAVYAKLDSAIGGKSVRGLKLDGVAGLLPVTVRSDEDTDGVRSDEASVRFLEGTRWRSLRLSRVRVHQVQPPESDSSYMRELIFLESPEAVRRALDVAGFRAPVAPGYSQLPDTHSPCGGAMQIETRPGGAALSCGWGC